MRSLLVIGCGNMGAALLAGALRNLPGLDATVLDSTPELARGRLPADLKVRFADDAADIAGLDADAVLLAVKPQVIPAVLEALGGMMAGALVISIAAGVTTDCLAAGLPSTTRVVRTMPNLPASVGAGMTVGYAMEGATDGDKAFVAEFFGSVGAFAWLSSEAEVDMATAVSGSGPGYVFAFTERLAQAGEAIGLPSETARLLARYAVVGAGALMASDARTAGELKTAVTSPGGTTQAGLAALEGAAGFPSCIPAAVAAAYRRAVQLAAPPAPAPPDHQRGINP